MNKIFAIIRREFIARVRTRTFLITTLLLPVFMVGVSVIPALMMRGGDRTTLVAIVDGTTNGFGASVQSALASETLSSKPDAARRYDVRRVSATERIDAVRDSLVGLTGLNRAQHPETLDGVLVLADSVLQTGNAEYLGTNTSGLESMGFLEASLSKVLRQARLAKSGVDPAVLKDALRGADLKTTKVSGGKATGESGTASFVIGYFMAFILYFSVVLYGQQTMMSVIEEKTSRIFEVLLATIRPEAMMAGKIIGVGSVGLTQVGIWLTAAVLLVGVSSVLHLGGGLFHISLTATQIIFFFVYFILGYLFYASIAAALGAMTNSEQELQQLNMFLVLPLLFCFVMLGSLLTTPDSTLARVLALVPPFTPLLMYFRVSLGHPAVWEIVLSLVLTSASICGIIWVTSRIYRIGVLMYGKRPSLPEILRWLKYS